ncbi:hypothetical protein [Paraburkholderia aromaticivorans]|uniref:Uncharacterized protein n=1 Tax=Paraburkholderia aromaticivorans TaxID=2026199 RepID=A0A248VVD7_9BURK|nr:hypothetical protein [Paraburkholderia aromaticivorans]ASW02999.1 hypothetical protein CJU94_29390 [Paraburkholderia aromaticivorans]
MGVRTVAAGAALAVWCMSGSAVAAGYAEVWNPPEETGHVTKQAGKKTGTAVKGKSGAAAQGASMSAAKSGQKHVGARHAAPHVASTAAHGSQPSAHGNVKKVAAKGSAKSGIKAAGANQTPSKAAAASHGKSRHAQVVQAKPGHGKVMHANLVQGRKTSPQTVKVAAKPDSAKPAASHVDVPAPSANAASSANVGATSANATSNPATASSGSLPPLIH